MLGHAAVKHQQLQQYVVAFRCSRTAQGLYVGRRGSLRYRTCSDLRSSSVRPEGVVRRFLAGLAS
eukprot:1944830-Alexandrium_andersonii.AAC.1